VGGLPLPLYGGNGTGGGILAKEDSWLPPVAGGGSGYEEDVNGGHLEPGDRPIRPAVRPIVTDEWAGDGDLSPVIRAGVGGGGCWGAPWFGYG
jgi:hypothetical protein